MAHVQTTDHRDDVEYAIRVDQQQYVHYVRTITNYLYISAVHGLEEIALMSTK
jgi:hypothetical protein